MNSPRLSRIAQGLKELNPTRNLPRSTISSTSPSARSGAENDAAQSSSAAAVKMNRLIGFASLLLNQRGPFAGFEPVVVAGLEPAAFVAEHNPVVEEVKRLVLALADAKRLYGVFENSRQRQKQLVRMLGNGVRRSGGRANPCVRRAVDDLLTTRGFVSN